MTYLPGALFRPIFHGHLRSANLRSPYLHIDVGDDAIALLARRSPPREELDDLILLIHGQLCRVCTYNFADLFAPIL